ncbi:MAG: nucleoside triphosphate pyrophosphohydrolase [Clostridia bacterium]|nr:nucleoside triphosphate pyrophosphohydrolase [Clostridia bacterium]
MPTIRHDKLVRDLIPDIIAADGKTCVTRTLTDAEYIAALDSKLGEELAEYLADGSMEELADLLEVMMAAAAARGHDFAEVEAIRQHKAAQRGGFVQRIWLESVTAPN